MDRLTCFFRWHRQRFAHGLRLGDEHPVKHTECYCGAVARVGMRHLKTGEWMWNRVPSVKADQWTG